MDVFGDVSSTQGDKAIAGYDTSVSRELLPGLLGGQDGLAKLVETILNQVLEAQVAEALGAVRHERTEERQGYRNGYRERTLYTRQRLGRRPTLRRTKQPPHGFVRLKTTAFTESYLQQKKDLTHCVTAAGLLAEIS